MGPGTAPTICASSTACCAIRRAPTSTASPSPAWPTPASWYATDQIPQRAVDQGLIGRYGNIDPTDGGFAHRYSLSARWNETNAEGATRVNAYVVKSDLALFNNFTYFLNNPIDGDQFKQADDRLIAGGSASQTFFGTGAGGLKSETTIGVQTRYDSIHAGLFNTKERDDPVHRARRPGAGVQRRRLRRAHAALDAVVSHHRRRARRLLQPPTWQATWPPTRAAISTRS